MKYCKISLLTFLGLLFGTGFSYGYNQQGFSQYQEGVDGISFSCVNQCAITLGEKDKVDYLNLDGTVNGNGIIGYGFLNGDQISLLNQYEVRVSSQINDYMNFVEYKEYLSSIPGNTDLLLLVNGNVNGNLYLDSGKFSFGQKITQGWKDFWEMETFTPYSINLRYGVVINGTSIVKYGYIIFIIVTILILLFNKGKKKKFKIIFYVGIGIFLFIGIRNIITYTHILNQGLHQFNSDGSYYDIGDYIRFTNEIREKLNLDSSKLSKDDCKIYINSYQERPFTTHREAFYLKPCERVHTGDMADYKIYYKTGVPSEDSNKKILLNYDNNYLLKNN